MAVNIRRITLWRAEVDNTPGALARTLEPLAGAGVDLQVVMGYRFPGHENKAAIEVAPVTRKPAQTAAQAGGLSAAPIPTLAVEGNNRPGLGHKVAQAVADAGVNLSFFIAQVIGKRYSAVIGLETEEDAKKVAAVIRKTTAPGAKKAGKKKAA